MKTRIFELKRKLSGENISLNYFFLELLSMANVKEQLIWAHQLFWQVLYKPFDHFFWT